LLHSPKQCIMIHVAVIGEPGLALAVSWLER
jgi:hypothetical protein